MPVLTLPCADPLSVRAKALVFEDPQSRALLARIEQVAPSEATILLHGETGTGKEIVARYVHERSARSARAFVAVNCGALPESLIESELFGHERGAFTGALQTKSGWFEAAHGGTLFLDEIGDLPLAMQVKLLRVLQESEVVRLGARTPISVDVRLIAATNVDLHEAVAAGRFREDLYYRLNVAPLTLLPLRDRPADILPIAEHFLGVYKERLRLDQRALLTREAERALSEHTWPGNIRELENAIHHALLVCQSGEIRPNDLRLQKPKAAALAVSAAPTANFDLDTVFHLLVEREIPNLFEHVAERLLVVAYDHCERNQVHTARLLGISRNVLRARLLQLGMISATPRTREFDRPTLPPSAAVKRSSSAPHKQTFTLRIGYQRFGLLPLVKASGALEHAVEALGARVEWHEFAGGMPLMEAIENRTLSLGLVGETPPVFAQAAQIPMVYLAAEAPAPEHEAIVVPERSLVRSVSELKGRTVLLSRGSNVHYFLIRALEAAELKYDDIRVAYAAPDRAQAMLEQSLVDAWATWEPYLGRVQRDTGARVLRNARGLTANTSYYVASRSFAAERPDLVEVFLEQVARVAQWARDNGEAALTLLASALGAPLSVAASTLGCMRAPEPFSEVHLAAQQAIADTLHRLQLIAAPVEVAQARWPATSSSTSQIMFADQRSLGLS
jgi:aliphatic sulfonates family ABC transporter substrate-binding protein